MKVFISISILGMITAGIYGLCDMSNDVLNGTMINYHESEQQLADETSQQSARVGNGVKMQFIANYNPAKMAVKEKQQVSISQITYSDYSRGGFEERTPEYASDLTSALREDSVALHQAQIASATAAPKLEPSSPAVANPKESGNVKEDKTDIIFQYYSRAPLKKKKTIVVKADKSGMDSTKVSLAKEGL